ncbi:MAG: dUTP diphosphatase [Candidatus Cloacimonetes bacterium]|nr:dUTP diphosphatase [Candidatus Cloacimonadota bacterium]MCF7814243.1 dUTP diphosphatase [Candidatus Cloacimonadota bacterium]MCF7868450.1 dUTP diphosphatase [Candidatus Cloacimonadota bacterium]MCF7883930.1 dUTP diphosphatase [Candidatus Cloacimonadota bacterium]
MLKINIQKLDKNAILPKRMTEHAAGYDLYSCHQKNIIIKSGEVKLIPIGLAIALPVGFEAQIRPRSGLAVKHQLGVLNSPGTIDADYRGEIKIILFNFGKTDFTIEPQTRIAQMVIAKHEAVNFELTEQLDETERGTGGFGHTNRT